VTKRPSIGVFSLVDDAHPAAPKLFEDVVMGDSLADDGVRARPA
jgi:hypothetical protein